MKKAVSIALLLAVMTVAVPAVHANCSWTVPPPLLNFGTYKPVTGGGLAMNITYSIRCTPNDGATLTFDVGAHATTFFPRNMAWNGNLAAYNLYDDANHTVVMGNGGGGTTKREVFNGSPQNKDFTDTIYGYIDPTKDFVPNTAGSYYNDFVTVTMTSGNTTSTRTFEIRVYVQPECTVETFGIAFGNYYPLTTNAGTPLDGETSVNVRCTRTTTITSVTMSAGSNFNPVTGYRRMISPSGAFLDYQIYRDPGRITVWNTTNVKSGVSASRDSYVSLVPDGSKAYGRVFANQDAPAEKFSDTVQATVNY